MNTRQAKIFVSVTTTYGETGGKDDFFEIDSGHGVTWNRDLMEVAFVYLQDIGETRVMAVLPGSPDYLIA
ncbi:hypothetical protein JVT61DRAFT_11958 [Boletus reticuloceps]|uniref:Uncharacterized protein n=1 Tax=Boletus reticuloceps TaxID=495285 RepID=A0A8I2YEJ8_9AGAM|nr:hypothetical protein JVT61DRAFT_11958 [Boletus reticuloceps]